MLQLLTIAGNEIGYDEKQEEQVIECVSGL